MLHFYSGSVDQRQKTNESIDARGLTFSLLLRSVPY